ncbi:MAG: CHAT domain-containing protein [Muribaculaceae bacterium]|nr:CHAT domain-containing protein [Muribaculaceae bacterium]
MTHFHRYLTFILVAVGAVMAACSYGNVKSDKNSKLERFEYIADGEPLTKQDSMIQEMLIFLDPDNKLSKNMVKTIRERIKDFPHKVVRRDTMTYFINTAYAIAYHEFRTHDYKEAKLWTDEFKKNAMPPDFLNGLFSYSAVGLNASNSLDAKGGFKPKKRKNQWKLDFSILGLDTLKYDWRRDENKFIENFIRDIPSNLSLSTYRTLMLSYKNGGGVLSNLNGFARPGWLQRCIEADREGILDLVCEVWDVDSTDFSIDKWGYFSYYPQRKEPIQTNKYNFDLNNYNPDYRKKRIDSILSANSEVELGFDVKELFQMYYGNSRYSDIIKECPRYMHNIEDSYLSRFHDYWALALSKLGRYEEALSHIDMALLHSTNPTNKTIISRNKANILGEMGATEQAVEILMQEKDELTDPYARFLWNEYMGYVYSRVDPEQSLRYYENADEYLDKNGLYQDIIVRHLCREANQHSDVYLRRKVVEEARRIADASLFGNLEKGASQIATGIIKMESFDYADAEKCFVVADSLLRHVSPEDENISNLNNRRALNLSFLNRSEEAVKILENQLTFQSKVYDSRHPEFENTVRTLLRVSCRTAQGAFSPDSLYRLWNQIKRLDRSNRGIFENLLAEIDYSLYKEEAVEAADMISNALSSSVNSLQRLELISIYEKICRENLPQEYAARIGSVLTQLKEDVMESMMLLTSNERKGLHIPLANILCGLVDSGLYKEACELSLFQKGMLFNTLRSVEKRINKKRSVKSLYQQLSDQRKRLNAAIAYNDSTHIQALTLDVAILERDLYYRVKNERNLLKSAKHSIEEIQSLLNRKDLALDFIKYEKDGIETYGVFVIDEDGFKQFFEICTEKEFLEDPVIIWSFLKTISEEKTDIYFCADSQLNNIGIEYYISPKERSKYRFHRLFHLADIFSASRKKYIGDDIIVVGVSDHNSPIGMSSDANRGSWTDLLNVEVEIHAISDRLANKKVACIYNDDAVEAAVKGLSGKSISTLHLTTHGFYRPQDRLEKAIMNPMDEDYNIARRFFKAGIQSLSGLVLRQGNLSWKSPEILDEEDDLLTAEEIEMLEFPNLQLTVLSACDTGLGTTDGEGVWGLQRAFRIAGTKNLICTLSEVNDYWSAQFMELFYDQAAKGESIYDAFHYAQKTLREENPDNPEIWGSFVLIE